MTFQHIHTLRVIADGGRTIGGNVTKTGAARQLLEESIAGESTDVPINFPLDVSAVQSFFMVSDKDITIETNDGTTPDDTIALKANMPYVWWPGGGTFALGTDVAVLYVTNAGEDAALLQIEALVDPTPA